jgi:hypothetical protein
MDGDHLAAQMHLRFSRIFALRFEYAVAQHTEGLLVWRNTLILNRQPAQGGLPWQQRLPEDTLHQND